MEQEILAPIVAAKKQAYTTFKALAENLLKERSENNRKAWGAVSDRHSYIGPAEDLMYDDAVKDGLKKVEEANFRLREAIDTTRQLGFDDMVQVVAGELGFDPVTLEPTKAALQKSFRLSALSGL